jgi:uncharacterized protein (TIGR00255 family)
MIKSMTGFGMATAENENVSATVEIRSINSKSLDVYIKYPNGLAAKEFDIKNMLNQHLERGKISVNIQLSGKAATFNKVKINTELIESYYKELQLIANRLSAPHDHLLSTVMQMPDIIQKETDDDEMEATWHVVQTALEKAIAACNHFRLEEGNALSDKISQYLNNIENLLVEIEKKDPERLIRTRERLQKQVQELINSDKFDANRFEQELIFYIEKLDISEEKVRLRTHLHYFKNTLQETQANGKKLGFISQEIGREINTIGAKANDADIQRLVVTMKDELEKIKEQSLNIL